MTAPMIALLDDDPAFLSHMHDLLTTAGYQTLRHRPQEVADMHALVTRFRPALVILDCWWRSGTAGWEFLKKIWADPATMRTGVILTTGQAVGPSLQIQILRAMRCPVVAEPLDRAKLLRAIEAVLGPERRTLTDAQPVPVPPATLRIVGEGTLDWANQAQLSDLLGGVLTHSDRRTAEEQEIADPIDRARYRLAHDEGTGRWMVLAIEGDARDADGPVRFFGPYDNERTARRRATQLGRAASGTGPTSGRKLAAMSDA